MAYGYNPPSRDDDAITYLPIDRAKANAIPFGPTDLRAAKATGGIRIGKSFVFVLDEAMPRLEAAHIAQACDNIVQGQESYPSLLYLSRARHEDVPALLEASQSYEIKVRWERLWVLSPFLARLARQEEGQQAILAGFGEDLAGVHLLSKFAEQNNPGVKRLFARLHDPLLALLLSRLREYRTDPRRAALLAGIIATLETKEDVLRAAMGPEVDEATQNDLLGMLYVKYPSGYGSKLSSVVLKEKLQTWRRD
jgi:hypothetical protein